MVKFSPINCRCCENLWTLIKDTTHNPLKLPKRLGVDAFERKKKSKGRHRGIWFRRWKCTVSNFPLLWAERDYSSKRCWMIQYLTKLFVLFGGKRLMNRPDWHFQQEGHWSGSLLKILIVLFTLQTMDDSEEICALSHTFTHRLIQRANTESYKLLYLLSIEGLFISS